MNKFIFLMYHFLFEDEKAISQMVPGDQKYGVNVDEFAWQMRYIKEQGYQSILLNQYLEGLKNDILPEKFIVITFDDGHVSTFTLAYPVLKQLGLIAEIFITSGWIGKKGFMTWDHVDIMNRDGFSIQSHTSTHPFITDLTETKITEELTKSKEQIEKKTGKVCEYFCPPGGRYSKKVKQMAIKSGYKAVCTSVLGYNNKKTDVMNLKRMPVFRNVSREEFKNIISGNSIFF